MAFPALRFDSVFVATYFSVALFIQRSTSNEPELKHHSLSRLLQHFFGPGLQATGEASPVLTMQVECPDDDYLKKWVGNSSNVVVGRISEIEKISE